MGKERMIPGDWRGCREGGTVLVEVESPWRGWRAVMVIVNRHYICTYVSSAMYENTRHFPHKYQDNWDFVHKNLYGKRDD